MGERDQFKAWLLTGLPWEGSPRESEFEVPGACRWSVRVVVLSLLSAPHWP